MASGSRRDGREGLWDLAVLCAAALLTVVLYTYPAPLALCLLGCWAAGFAWRLQERDLAYFWASVLVGTVVELLCVRLGLWSYPHPSLLGVPLWIPLGWGLVVLAIKRDVVRRFTRS